MSTQQIMSASVCGCTCTQRIWCNNDNKPKVPVGKPTDNHGRGPVKNLKLTKAGKAEVAAMRALAAKRGRRDKPGGRQLLDQATPAPFTPFSGALDLAQELVGPNFLVTAANFRGSPDMAGFVNPTGKCGTSLAG